MPTASLFAVWASTCGRERSTDFLVEFYYMHEDKFMTEFIKKKVMVEEPDASMTFRPGQFRRKAFSLEEKNIYLIGMRASGKTTVGRALAAALDCAFKDTDAVITEKSGESIDALVARHGWARFREMEKEALAEVATLPGKVLATGGGIVLDEEDRRLMGETGIMFYLAADAALLAKRLMADPQTEQRPALTVLSLHDEIVTVMSEREPLYMACMDHMLQAHREVEQLVDDILVALGLREWDYTQKERILDRY